MFRTDNRSMISLKWKKLFTLPTSLCQLHSTQFSICISCILLVTSYFLLLATLHWNLFTNLYREDQMLLLAGLHLLHLHVPVITTHLCTGWIGRGNDGAWMLLFVIAPMSSVSLTTVLAGEAVAGSAASAPILSSRDIMEQQQHHCNSKTKIASHSHFNFVWTETLQTGVCCVSVLSVSVYNFNPNSPNARVHVCVSVAETLPNELEASPAGSRSDDYVLAFL